MNGLANAVSAALVFGAVAAYLLAGRAFGAADDLAGAYLLALALVGARAARGLVRAEGDSA
jgi:hypothetical protein